MGAERQAALTWDQCQVGARYGAPERVVTQADIARFAELTGDANPVHVDPEHARRTPFRGCIAHGMLVQSFAAGMMWQSGVFEGTVVAVQQVAGRFVAPVRPGDTLVGSMTVAALDPEPAAKRGWVEWSVALVNQRGEAVFESTWRLVMARARASG